MLKKIIRRLLFVGVCLITLVALFYAEENWRGKHAWETYRRGREAMGDTFELSAIMPPPVPDDQNLAATPLFAELFPKPPVQPRLAVVELPGRPTVVGNWREGRVEDLVEWQRCFTNSNLLAALAKYGPVLDEVAAACRRPYCRFPIRYEDGFNALLPHLHELRQLSLTYRLRALAELSAGQTDVAFQDVRLCFRLADTIKDEPLLISFLVRTVILENAMQPVWEGLAAHRWNDNQLAVLQAELKSANQFDSLAKALRGERVLVSTTTRWLIDRPSDRAKLINSTVVGVYCPEQLKALVVRTAPTGWLYQNALRVDRYYTEELLPAVDFATPRVNPRAVAAANHMVETLRPTPYSIFVKLLVPACTKIAQTAARSQTGVDEAAVACALERYRLAHGQLPENLDALAPQYIAKVPHDVIDGQPLRYQRLANEQFMLYSVGWNETDDGGQIALTREKTPRQDLEKGDWVWSSQPLSSERK